MEKAHYSNATVLAETNGGQDRRSRNRRYLVAAVATLAVLAIGAVSWCMLYIGNLNVGD